MSLTNKILLAMVLGIVVGIIFNLIIGAGDAQTSLGVWIQTYLIDGLFDTIGQIFIRSLKLLVVPMVFVSLVCGSAALGGHSRMGVMAAKTMSFYIFTTPVAIMLALFVAFIVQPGEGMNLAADTEVNLPTPPSFKQTLINIVPENPVLAMAQADMLQVIVFALLFGIAISRMENPIAQRMKDLFNDLNAVVLKIVMILMHIAPYGVFCLLVKLFSSLGMGAVLDLAKYFFTVLFVLLLHGLGVYSTMLKLLSGLSPLTFFRKMRPVMVFGFSTASSNATMPVTMRVIEHDLGVDNKIASFSVPLGTTINMDGTSIMQGVATAFIAQAYGIDIGLSGYLMVVLTATLATIGTAGVPGVGMITLAMVLQQVGLPLEGIALIIGVDRLLDMVRTVVNIMGDGIVSLIVARSEGLLDEERFTSAIKSVEDSPTRIS